MRSPKRFRGRRNGNNARDDGNRGDPISLPKWATLQNYRYEPVRDFPAGPYNRMIGRLHPEGRQSMEHMDSDRLDPRMYSSGGQLLHFVDQGRLDAPPARFYAGIGCPRHYIDERRQEDEIPRLYSAGGQHLRCFNKLSLDFSPAVFYSENGRPTHFDNEARLDPASARLHLAGAQHIRGADGTRLDDASAALRAADGQLTDPIDEGRLDKAPARLLSSGKSDCIDNTRQGNAPAGIIFMCSKTTKKDCFQHKLFGLPMMHKQLVERIVPGTKLFLFEFDTRELHGIFEADSNGGINLDCKAFGGSFPAQVQFRIYKECKSLAEKDFKNAIQDNYYKQNKFNLELTSEQVLNLVQMFCPGEVLEKREESHAMALPDNTNAVGVRERPLVETLGSQQRLPRDLIRYPLAAHNLPPLESDQRLQHLPFMENQGYVRPAAAVAREFQPLFMDGRGLRIETPMDHLTVRLRGLESTPIERSLHYHPRPLEGTAVISPSLLGPGALLGPSARGLMNNEVPYMDARRRFQPPLLENPRLVPASIGSERGLQVGLGESPRYMDPPSAEQPRSIHSSDMRLQTHVNNLHEPLREDQANIFERSLLVGSQRDPQPSLGESPREMCAPLVEQSRSMHPFGTRLQAHANTLEPLLGVQADIQGNERDYLTNQRIENNHSSREADVDGIQDSLHQSHVPSSDLQSRGTAVQGHRFRNSNVEITNFHSLDSIYPSYVANAGLQSFDTGVKDQRFNQLDAERRNLYTDNSLQHSLHPSNELSYGLESQATGVQGPRLSDAEFEKSRHCYQEPLLDSVHPYGVPSSGLRSDNAGVEGQKFSDLNVDRGNLHSQASMMADSYVMEQNRFWYERYYSDPIQSYANELDIARRQRSEYLERVYHMYEQELAEENNNEQQKELHSPHISKHPGEENLQEDVEGTTEGNQPVSDGYPDKPGDASCIHTYKRMYEDPIMGTTNSYSRKRTYSYNESLENRVVEERNPVNEAATTAGVTD